MRVVALSSSLFESRSLALLEAERIRRIESGTKAIYRRYAIVDATAMRAGAAKLAKLHKDQSKTPQKVLPMTAGHRGKR